MKKIVLSLDLSTTATGWARFNLDTKELIDYGFLKPILSKIEKKYLYPAIQLSKMRNLSDQILPLITEETTHIVIEEINRGKNRLGQKVLDGFHFILMDRLPLKEINKVIYRDSDGSDGWRSRAGLALQLSDFDKDQNKQIRKFNNKLAKGEKDVPVINQKTLACRFVNKKFGLNLNSEVNSTDGDIADAIGLGYFMITKVIK